MIDDNKPVSAGLLYAVLDGPHGFYQRGFSLISLAIWGVIAVVVLAFIHHAIQTYFVDPAVKVAITRQLAADEIQMDQTKADRDKWMTAEKQRELENNTMQGQLQSLTGTLSALDKISAAKIANSEAKVQEQAKTAAAFSAENERLRVESANARAASPPLEQLKRIDDEQLRYYRNRGAK